MIASSRLLVEEAYALEQRLNEVWDRCRHDSPYAERLIMLAQRAHYRRLRRAAHWGDPKAQHWFGLMERVVSR